MNVQNFRNIYFLHFDGIHETALRSRLLRRSLHLEVPKNTRGNVRKK